MKRTEILAILVLILGLIVWTAEVSNAAPMGTAWNYQGRLMDANSPAAGAYDFLFTLFDEPNGGGLLLSIDVNDINVIDGYFRVEMDFSSDVFDGEARWLEILVRPGDSNDFSDFVALNPRQEITPVPYALQTRGIFVDDAGRVGIGTTNPQSLLQVGDASINYTDDPDSSIGIDDSTPEAKLEITIAPDNTNKDFLMLSSTADQDGDYLVVKNHGYVGIGVTDPLNVLSVLSASGGDGISVVNNSGDSRILLSIAGGDWGFIEVSDESSEQTRIAPNTSFFSGNVGIGTTNPQGKLEVSHDSAAHDLVVNSSTGNVGIGTTNPQGKLEVSHDSAAHDFVVNSSTGYVGIGVTDPLNVLSVLSASGGDGISVVNNSGDSRILLSIAGGDWGFIEVGDGSSERTKIAPNTSFFSGNVGIGTTNPQGKLEVSHDSAAHDFVVNSSTGYVGIGTTNPSTVLSLGTEVNPIISVASTDGSDSKFLGLAGGGGWGHVRGSSIALHGNEHVNRGTMWFRVGWDAATMTGANDGDLIIQTANTERFRIDKDGNVGIGTANPSSKLHVAGGCIMGSMCSDIRLKKNIEPLPLDDSILDRVVGLQAVTFEWKHRDDSKRQIGLIAQDVEEVFPEVVTTPDDGTCEKGLLATGIDAVLVEAIKELKVENELLREKLEILERRMDERQFAIAKEVQ